MSHGLEVMVRSADGKPVEKAVLILFGAPTDYPFLKMARSWPNGRAIIPFLHENYYRGVVFHPDHGMAEFCQSDDTPTEKDGQGWHFLHEVTLSKENFE